jgi:hypothetical protein
MTTLTLNKLPEGFIVTSDEGSKKGELTIFPTTENGRIVKLNTPKIAKSDYAANSIYNLKVIAQQDQISFSEDIPEEKLREIGWYDFLKMGRDYANKKWENYCDRENPTHEEQEQDLFKKILGIEGSTYDWCKGFQKSQELLSDRRFTLEEVGELLQQIVRIIPEQELRKWTKESFVKHFVSLENRSWTIEVETEEYVQEETGTELKWVGRRPKFTNGKIKITKIL